MDEPVNQRTWFIFLFFATIIGFSMIADHAFGTERTLSDQAKQANVLNNIRAHFGHMVAAEEGSYREHCDLCELGTIEKQCCGLTVAWLFNHLVLPENQIKTAMKLLMSYNSIVRVFYNEEMKKEVGERNEVFLSHVARGMEAAKGHDLIQTWENVKKSIQNAEDDYFFHVAVDDQMPYHGEQHHLVILKVGGKYSVLQSWEGQWDLACWMKWDSCKKKWGQNTKLDDYQEHYAGKWFESLDFMENKSMMVAMESSFQDIVPKLKLKQIHDSLNTWFSLLKKAGVENSGEQWYIDELENTITEDNNLMFILGEGPIKPEYLESK